VVLLGLLASEKTTAEAVRAFLAKTRVPVVCTYQGAGVVPPELFARFGGRVGLFRTQPADKLLDAADLIIAIGYNPIEYDPGLWNRGGSGDWHGRTASSKNPSDYRVAVPPTFLCRL
jgi:acetolactate synthase-1/2/3 large subunit